MDYRNQIKIKSSCDANRIDSLDHDWEEYRTRAAIVLDEFEGILNKPIINAIDQAGYADAVKESGREEDIDDTLAYMYGRLAYRAANRVEDGMTYYAITGDPGKIEDDIDVDDPAKFWMESLDYIKQNLTADDLKEAFRDMLDSLFSMEAGMRMIDMFAIKAIRKILDMPPLI